MTAKTLEHLVAEIFGCKVTFIPVDENGNAIPEPEDDATPTSR